MAKDYRKLMVRLLGVYKVEELAAILKVTARSVANYKAGGNPTIDAQREIDSLTERLAANNWQAIPVRELLRPPGSSEISAESVLLQVLVREFADYKAEKEGLDAKKIIKDIESKARLILDVANKI